MIGSLQMKKVRLPAILLLGVSGAVAQRMPVMARIRETTESLGSGTRVQKEIREGIYLRMRDGSTLTHWTRFNGVEKPGTGNLLNNSTLHSYLLLTCYGIHGNSRLGGL